MKKIILLLKILDLLLHNLKSYIFIIIILSSINLYAKCSFQTSKYLNELSDLSSIKNIEIKVYKNKKWIINYYKASMANDNIKKRYKKKHKAKIKVNYSFGYCEYPAKIRLSGDLKDHLGSLDNNPFPSLDIKLLKGNIANKVKFKLLRPQTRQSKNEIFFINTLRSLGYLAPLTSFVNVTQFVSTRRMLFQEKAAKELLEGLYHRESVILEGDETFLTDYKEYSMFAKKDISLAKVINGKWASKGENSWKITKNAFLKLQTIYINQRLNGVWQSINPKLLANDISLQNKWKYFDILMYSARALHGSYLHNRKFYWNSFLNSFEPIYYDGNVNPFRGTGIDEKSKTLFLSRITKSDCDYVISLLNNELLNEKNEKKIEFINQIKSNINDLKDNLRDDTIYIKEYSNYLKNYTNYSNRLFNQVTNFNISYIERVENDTILLKVCTKGLCEVKKYTYSDMIDLFEKTGKKISLETVLVQKPNQNNLKKKSRTLLKEFSNFSIEYTNGSLIEINEKKKLIILRPNNSGAWFLFKNGKIDDYTIKWDGANIKKNIKQRFNQYGLTGCVSFYNIDFNNSKIYSNNSYCEDSINIINSKGNIDLINITNAKSDALDIDFSTLSIGEVVVKNAGNDCIDMSSGKYKINDTNLSDCVDKAISIGEQSIMDIDNVRIDKANIAVSSKDSSIVTIKKLFQENSKICAQAYRKKQEYNGAILNIEESNCKKSDSHKDLESQIIGLD